MSQHPIEIILLRQWAGMMSVPIWISDASGTLLFFNEATEQLIGLRFEDAGELPPDEISNRFVLCDLDGEPLPPEQRPLVTALERRRPAQREMLIRSEDGSWKRIAVTAIPLVGEGQRHLGAMVLLWDTNAADA